MNEEKTLKQKTKETEEKLKKKAEEFAKKRKIKELEEKIALRKKELKEKNQKNKINKEVIDYLKLMEKGGLKIIENGKIKKEAVPFAKAAKKMIEHNSKMRQIDENIKEQMMEIHEVFGKRTQEEMIKLRKLQKNKQ